MHLGTWEHEKMSFNELRMGIQSIGKAKAGTEIDLVSETGKTEDLG